MVALVVVEVVRVRNAAGLIIPMLISFKALVIGAKSHLEETSYKKNGRPNDKSNMSTEVPEYNFCADSDNTVSSNNQFIIDSGATSHMIRDRNLFNTFETKANRVCLSANSSSAKIEGTGSVAVSFINSNGNKNNVILNNCLYLPSHSKNLISVSALEKRGYLCLFPSLTI